MKDKPKVVLSVNHDGAAICVDIFQRPDGTYGFEEYRRDPEDNTGWFEIGHHAHKIFTDIDSAKDAAFQHIHWLDGF
ncbi:hypothetical protein N9M73_07815 [Rhodobacteraceae bacterium]|nr:hypothetical protein [Paracoccaceae bacterium]